MDATTLTQGLNASSDVFNRMSDDILREVCPAWFLKVVDDIIIFGDTQDEAYKRLETILEIFQKHGLIVSAEKIQEATNICWCGFKLVIPEGGGPISISPTEDKIRGIRDYPLPRTRTQVRRFLGLCTQIQSWTPELQINLHHLHQLTSEQNTF